MKKTKKILALVLAMVMVIGTMSMTAFAALGDFNINIINEDDSMSINGKQYKAYKVFTLTLGGKTTTTDPETQESTDSYSAYAYSIKNTDWAWAKLVEDATTNSQTGVITTKYGITLIPSAADPTNYVVDGATMIESNARALADALQSVLPNTADGMGNGGSDETATIELSEPGYYAVYGVVIPTDPEQTPAEEVIAAVALTTTDPDADVSPKASVPTLDKKIKAVSEDGTDVDQAVLDDNGKAAVAKVGSAVSYELTATTPDLTGYSDYTFVIGDSISTGLTYDKTSFELKIDGTGKTYVTSETSAIDDIELVFDDDDKGFTLTIPYSVLNTAGKGKKVVLTYKCTVNDSALTYDYENNTAKLTYSNNPYDDTTNDTPEKKTYVVDLNLDVDKIDGADSSNKLDGATFKLYKEVTTTTPADPDDPNSQETTSTSKKYYKWADNKVTWVDTQAAGDSFVTDSTGKFTTQVRGLDKGTYFLEETVAPLGYNLLAAPVEVSIVAEEASNGETVTYSATYDGATATVTNGVINLTTETQASDKQPVATGTIENNSGSELPSTGGIGTTIFYMAGAILAIGAGVLMVARRRMNIN